MDAMPLAIQLVRSVREMKRFLRTVSEAPEELKRLMHLLEQLEFILENVGILVQRQRGNTMPTGSDILASVSRAVKTCERHLMSLGGIINASKEIRDAPTRAVRALGSFKLACKKKELEIIVQQVHESVNLLNLTMMANITSICSTGIEGLQSQVSNTNHATNTINNQLTLLRRDLFDPRGLISNESDIVSGEFGHTQRSLRSRVSKRQINTYHSYTAIFGKLRIRRVTVSKTSGHIESNQQTSYAESSWMLMSSFFSHCFEYQSVSNCGYIQRALRTYPVIPEHHPIWLMCRLGKLDSIRKLLITGTISPFSLDTRGFSLLHHATWNYRVETCKFLFDLGMTGQEFTSSGLAPSLPPLEKLDNSSELRDMYSLFTSKCVDLDDEDFFCDLFIIPSLEISLQRFQCILDEVISKISMDGFSRSPILTAMSMLHNSEPESRTGWLCVINRLLTFGLDIHDMLEEILDIATCPFESELVGEEWLGILESFGIHVEEYLTTMHDRWGAERTLMTTPPFVDEGDIRWRVHIISRKSPRLSWDWYFDPEGHASEVLYEFRNWGPLDHLLWEDYQTPSSNWPYFYPRWESCRSLLRWNSTSETTKMSIKAFIENSEKRFERRWLKKVKKWRKAHGIKNSPRLPGAWID